MTLVNFNEKNLFWFRDNVCNTWPTLILPPLLGTIFAETITQNNVLFEDVNLSAAYQIDFDLTLTGTVDDSWTNILSVHVPGANSAWF